MNCLNKAGQVVERPINPPDEEDTTDAEWRAERETDRLMREGDIDDDVAKVMREDNDMAYWLAQSVRTGNIALTNEILQVRNIIRAAILARVRKERGLS